MASVIKDLTGQRFGRLLALSRAESGAKGQSRWNCQCSCGKSTVVYAGSLQRGKTKSCGCLHAEGGANIRDLHTHGESRSAAEYRTWESIKTRCYNPRFKFYKYYGALGVTVCDRWLHSYENFLADMGRKPTPQHSIDRFPDPYGNYEPGNCRWATAKEQANNKRARTA